MLLSSRGGVRSKQFNICTDQQLTCLRRCDAKPDNLDAGDAHLRSQIKTEFLVNNWNPGILWTDFGVRADIVVSLLADMSLPRPERAPIAIHIWFPARQHSRAFVSRSSSSGNQRDVQRPHRNVGERVFAGYTWRDMRARDYCRH